MPVLDFFYFIFCTIVHGSLQNTCEATGTLVRNSFAIFGGKSEWRENWNVV